MRQEIPGRGPKVLCIDDDRSFLRVLTVQLQAHGFVPLQAPDGPTGLALAAADRPRLILLDIMMPGMDGFEVCRRLRADPRTRAIPLIILTALGDPRMARRAAQAGAALALSKPFEPAELTATLRKALALQEERLPA